MPSAGITTEGRDGRVRARTSTGTSKSWKLSDHGSEAYTLAVTWLSEQGEIYREPPSESTVGDAPAESAAGEAPQSQIVLSEVPIAAPAPPPPPPIESLPGPPAVVAPSEIAVSEAPTAAPGPLPPPPMESLPGPLAVAALSESAVSEAPAESAASEAPPSQIVVSEVPIAAPGPLPPLPIESPWAAGGSDAI